MAHTTHCVSHRDASCGFILHGVNHRVTCQRFGGKRQNREKDLVENGKTEKKWWETKE